LEVEAWGRAHVSLEERPPFQIQLLCCLLKLWRSSSQITAARSSGPAARCWRHVPSGHLSRIARGVGTHPNRYRQDSRGHPCPNGAEVLCPRAWNVPRIDAFRRLREPEGYEQSLRIPAACTGMPQSCQHGEVFSTQRDASQDGYRLGNTRQRLHQDGGRAGANCPPRKRGTEEP
jgi:hypothetical protein